MIESKLWINKLEESPEKAWDIFLGDNHNLIMAVISKMAHQHDEQMDLYTYTLDHLKENELSKLTSYFTKPRNFPFEAWLAVVVKNCCMDWFRSEKGRRRLLKCIEALPPVDQWIFRYIYWYRCSYDVTFEFITNKHEYLLTFEEMCARAGRIEEILHEKTQWRILEGWHSILPSVPLEDTAHETPKNVDPDSQNNSNASDFQLIRSDSEKIMKETLSKLPSLEQLIVQCYFYHGKTLEETTRFLRLKNIWQVRRKLQKALKTLKKELKKRSIDPSDLDLS